MTGGVTNNVNLTTKVVTQDMPIPVPVGGKTYYVKCSNGVNIKQLNAAAIKGELEFQKFCSQNKLIATLQPQTTDINESILSKQPPVSMDGVYHAGNVTKTLEKQEKDGIVNISNTGQDYAVAPKTNVVGMDLNPDAGAGAAAVVTPNNKMTVNLANIPPEIRTQPPFSTFLVAGDKDGNYEIKPENYKKLKALIEKHYNTPNNIDIKTDDPEYDTQIKQSLVNLGVYDQDGNVKDPEKLAQIIKEGLTVNGKKYYPETKIDEQIGIEVTTTTNTDVSTKFKKMDPAAVKKIKPEQLKELEKQGFVTKVGDTYYTTEANLQAKGATEIGSTTEIKPEALVGNKSLQDVREKELQQDFLKAYDTNSDNAFDALLHTKYYKEYKKLEDSLIDLDSKDMADIKNKDYKNEPECKRKGILARTYFAQSKNMKGETVFEYATKEDVEQFKKDVASKLDELKKLPQERRVSRYITAFGGNIDDLSDSQLQELAEQEVYAKGLDKPLIKRMASIQFKNRFNTQMNNVYNDYQEKIVRAQAKGNAKKVSKLQAELDEKLQEISKQKVETENQDRADYANMMARGQLNSEIGEGNFKNTNPTYASIIAKVPQAEQFIKANKNIFFTKDTSGKEVFNAQKWKDFWLNQSSSRRDNTVSADNKRVQDYYMTLGEAQDVVDGNARGRANEKFKGLGAIYTDLSQNERINLARDMAESAGIVTEKNKTAGIRAAYVLGETTKGAGIVAATDILTNAVISKIKIPYAGTVAGSVPFAKSGVIQDFDKFVTKNYSNGKLVSTIETNVLEEHKWEIKEDVEYKDKYSGSKKLGDWHVDPWAVGVGGIAGMIKGLAGMKKKHDKQDGKSEIQMYARDNYNRRTLSTPENVVTASDPITTKKFVFKLAESTPKQENIANRTHKMVVKRGGVETTGPHRGQAYNLAEDKADYVSKLYGVEQGTPEFDKLYTYIMEEINGVKQYKPHQFKNDKTYEFPETLPKEITGLDKDYKAGAEPPKKFIKIYLANGVKTNITGKAKQLQGASGKNVHATITASHKRKVT